MVVLLLVGCVGSGKSTYCKSTLKDYYRISQDEMGKEQALINFKEAVKRKEPYIVVDRMNFNKFQRKRWIENAKGYTIKAMIFDVPKDVCIARAKVRLDHPTLKPEKVEDVAEMYHREFEKPELSEGIDQILVSVHLV